jgi:hypothetical protein
MSKKSDVSKNFIKTILYFCFVFIIIIIGFTIYRSVKYSIITDNINTFTMINLQKFLKDLKIQYELGKDPNHYYDISSKMSKDLENSLLYFYNDNINITQDIIRNLTSSHYGETGDNSFKTDVEQFISVLVHHIPLHVLYKSTYLSRFFEMILMALPSPIQDTVYSSIRAEIVKIINKFK